MKEVEEKVRRSAWGSQQLQLYAPGLAGTCALSPGRDGGSPIVALESLAARRWAARVEATGYSM